MRSSSSLTQGVCGLWTGAVPPLDIRASLLEAGAGAGGWVTVGEVMRGSPFTGLLHAIYDPSLVAARHQAQGAGAVAVKVDQT